MGNPNGQGLTQWPAYSSSVDALLDIGDEIIEREEFLKARLDFHEARGLEKLTAAQ
jgi:hypothetical protein